MSRLRLPTIFSGFALHFFSGLQFAAASWLPVSIQQSSAGILIISHCRGWFQKLFLGVCLFDVQQGRGFHPSAGSDLPSAVRLRISRNHRVGPRFSRLNDPSYCPSVGALWRNLWSGKSPYFLASLFWVKSLILLAVRIMTAINM